MRGLDSSLFEFIFFCSHIIYFYGDTQIISQINSNFNLVLFENRFSNHVKRKTSELEFMSHVFQQLFGDVKSSYIVINVFKKS